MQNRTDIHITHFLPGRVRLRVGAIKGNREFAERLRTAFLTVPGLTDLTYNTTTGSVLILYDSHRIVAEDGGSRLRAVMREHLPDLDADAVIHWLGGATGRT